ncbi:mechanosensitive ion channel family protein, partial [Pseudomonas frederiksbergensis]|nr:mechanosensitive ion channel family protein [Pseudomonas frederiksbergensis]
MGSLQWPLPVEWIAPFWLGLQILLILSAAFILQRVVARCLKRLGERYPLPPELLMPLRGGLRWLIMGSALIFVLERLGVSATVLW